MHGLQPILKSLVEMMDFDNDRGSNWVAKFMWSCLDVTFVDMMINLASGKVKRSISGHMGLFCFLNSLLSMLC